MKYRTKVFENGNGVRTYVPQKRVFGFWINMNMPNGGPITYYHLSESVAHINRHIANVIGKKNAIKKCVDNVYHDEIGGEKCII